MHFKKRYPSIFKIYNPEKTECLKVYKDRLVFLPSDSFLNLLIKSENILYTEILYSELADISVSAEGNRKFITAYRKSENGSVPVGKISYSVSLENDTENIIKYVKSKIENN